MKKISYIALALLVAASCTYPFRPDIPNLEDRLVIEGDLLVGDEASVNVSYMMALNAEGAQLRPNVVVDVFDDKGGIYPGAPTGKGSARVDLRTAPYDRRYRLRVKNVDRGRTYYSEWQDVQTAPEIDSLGYLFNADTTQMYMTISLTAMDSQKYYRWTFYEEWEYHSYYQAMCYCIPGNMNAKNPRDTVARLVYFQGNENNYWCWNNAWSDGILLGTVEGLNENRLVNHKFATISNRSRKMSYLYRMTVTLQAISQDGYDYWKNLDAISYLGGSFDSPNPSEMPGNIHCEEDPSEYVIGFINVSGVTRAARFIDAARLKFYDDTDDRLISKIVEGAPSDWNTLYYAWNYRPVTMLPQMNMYHWADGRCVDCTMRGGSKDKKPADWPNDHI